MGFNSGFKGLNIQTFYLHLTVYIFSMFSEQTAIISLFSMN